MKQMQMIAVKCISIPIADMERSVAFYTIVLSFKKIPDVEVSGEDYDRLLELPAVKMRIVRLQLGDEMIELVEYLNPKGRPIPADSHSDDQWFQHLAIVVSDIDQAYHQLRNYQVQQVSVAPQTIPDSNPASGGVKPFYFKDPDGHNLELIDFPPDKGNAKWQQTDRLFLGIDHTAIVVFSTEKSLHFYRDFLGLELNAQSRNVGTEQEDLSRVPDANVRVTSLKPPAGIGIELLEYLSPHNGRSTPTDTHTNDLWCWQTTIVVQDLSTTVQQLQTVNHPIRSAITVIPEPASSLEQGFLTKDPDGHVIRLIEQ